MAPAQLGFGDSPWLRSPRLVRFATSANTLFMLNDQRDGVSKFSQVSLFFDLCIQKIFTHTISTRLRSGRQMCRRYDRLTVFSRQVVVIMPSLDSYIQRNTLLFAQTERFISAATLTTLSRFQLDRRLVCALSNSHGGRQTACFQIAPPAARTDVLNEHSIHHITYVFPRSIISLLSPKSTMGVED